MKKTQRHVTTFFCDHKFKATKRVGGHVKFYPHEKGGGKSFSHAEGGGGGQKKFWGSFYAVA